MFARAERRRKSPHLVFSASFPPKFFQLKGPLNCDWSNGTPFIFIFFPPEKSFWRARSSHLSTMRVFFRQKEFFWKFLFQIIAVGKNRFLNLMVSLRVFFGAEILITIHNSVSAFHINSLFMNHERDAALGRSEFISGLTQYLVF